MLKDYLDISTQTDLSLPIKMLTADELCACIQASWNGRNVATSGRHVSQQDTEQTNSIEEPCSTPQPNQSKFHQKVTLPGNKVDTTTEAQKTLIPEHTNLVSGHPPLTSIEPLPEDEAIIREKQNRRERRLASLEKFKKENGGKPSDDKLIEWQFKQKEEHRFFGKIAEYCPKKGVGFIEMRVRKKSSYLYKVAFNYQDVEEHRTSQDPLKPGQLLLFNLKCDLSEPSSTRTMQAILISASYDSAQSF
ncbi:hypothetical protein [Endozoicomonas sp.]|uniref:hypothetical protein n=1 Tax=Endozoicomonas sp. TaxID=1892382 RepID=UPI00288626D6|nr:hypothetical protein [Endozoicomonas sp.]